MYCVTVLFTVQPERFEHFATRIARQARDSLSREAGCHQFDVWTSPGNPNQLFLYEIYADRAAFEGHLETKHFTAFDRETSEWVVSKTVGTWVQQQ